MPARRFSVAWHCECLHPANPAHSKRALDLVEPGFFHFRLERPHVAAGGTGGSLFSSAWILERILRRADHFLRELAAECFLSRQ